MAILMDPELLSSEIIDMFKPYLPMELCLELTKYYNEMRYPKQYLLMARCHGDYDESTTEHVMGIYSNFSNALFDYFRCYYPAYNESHHYDTKNNIWTYSYQQCRFMRSDNGQVSTSQLESLYDMYCPYHYIVETPTNFNTCSASEVYTIAYYVFNNGKLTKYITGSDCDICEALKVKDDETFELPNVPALKSFRFPEK